MEIKAWRRSQKCQTRRNCDGVKEKRASNIVRGMGMKAGWVWVSTLLLLALVVFSFSQRFPGGTKVQQFSTRRQISVSDQPFPLLLSP